MKEGGRVSVTHYQYHIKGGGVGVGGKCCSIPVSHKRGMEGKCCSIPVSHKRGREGVTQYQYHIRGAGG